MHRDRSSSDFKRRFAATLLVFTFVGAACSGGPDETAELGIPSTPIAAAATTAPVATVAPDPTAEPEPTVAPEPTAEPEPTVAAEPTAEPEPTVAPEPTAEPEPTVAPEPTAEPEPTVAPEPTAEPEPTVAPEPTAVAAADDTSIDPVILNELEALAAGPFKMADPATGALCMLNEIRSGGVTSGSGIESGAAIIAGLRCGGDGLFIVTPAIALDISGTAMSDDDHFCAVNAMIGFLRYDLPIAQSAGLFVSEIVPQSFVDVLMNVCGISDADARYLLNA